MLKLIKNTMLKLNKNSNGFAAIELGLLVLLIALIAGTGWYVVKARSNANKSFDNASKSSQITAKKANSKTQLPASETPTVAPPKCSTYESKNGDSYQSSGGEYKIKLIEGLTFFCSGDAYSSLVTQDTNVEQGAAAKVVPKNLGNDYPYGIFLNYYANSKDAAANGGVKQTGFKTQSGLVVEKYYYYQATDPEGLGIGKGGKDYKYIVTSDSKALTIEYSFGPADSGILTLVEQMVKTVHF